MIVNYNRPSPPPLPDDQISMCIFKFSFVGCPTDSATEEAIFVSGGGFHSHRRVRRLCCGATQMKTWRLPKSAVKGKVYCLVLVTELLVVFVV